VSQHKSAPRFILLAGPNGAGKSTYYERVVKPLADRFDAEFINADVIEKQRWPNEVGIRSYEAAQIAASRRRNHIEQGKSFVSETVFSHPSKIEQLKEAQASGFFTHLIFVGLAAPELAIARVAKRVEAGGHNVPKDKIRERYYRNQIHLKTASTFVDRLDVFDNSKEGQQHQAMMQFIRGQLIAISPHLPDWLTQLFQQEISAFRKSQTK
jgi:predicted ABC-type ATPase